MLIKISPRPLLSMVFVGFGAIQPLVSMVFDGHKPLDQRCDGYDGSLTSFSAADRYELLVKDSPKY